MCFSAYQHLLTTSASRAQVLPARFSACWGTSPIPPRTLLVASGCSSETDAYNRGCATTSENTPCEFSSLSRHLRSTSGGAKRQGLVQAQTLARCSRKKLLPGSNSLKKESHYLVQQQNPLRQPCSFTCACDRHASGNPHQCVSSSLLPAGHCSERH